MTFYVDNEHEYTFSFEIEDVFKRVAKEVLSLEKCPYDTEISLTIVNEEEIKQTNYEFREIDSVTDVLSFPYLEFESPGEFPEVSADDINPENNEVVLGDIIICYERAIKQAQDYGHSELREFAFLIAHSMLHLSGYDHMTDEEAKVMFDKQEYILNKLGYTRNE